MNVKNRLKSPLKKFNLRESIRLFNSKNSFLLAARRNRSTFRRSMGSLNTTPNNNITEDQRSTSSNTNSTRSKPRGRGRIASKTEKVNSFLSTSPSTTFLMVLFF